MSYEKEIKEIMNQVVSEKTTQICGPINILIKEIRETQKVNIEEKIETKISFANIENKLENISSNFESRDKTIIELSGRIKVVEEEIKDLPEIREKVKKNINTVDEIKNMKLILKVSLGIIIFIFFAFMFFVDNLNNIIDFIK